MLLADRQTALYFQVEDNHPGAQNKVLQLAFSHKDPENRSYSFMTKDHIVARAKGGANHISNYQPMCLNCNREKRTTDNETFVPTWMHRPNRSPLVVNHWYTPFINWFKRFSNTTPPITIEPIKVKPVSKRITITTKNKSKTKNNKINILIYKGYIRWYTQVFHSHATLSSWRQQIKGIISHEMKKAYPDFDPIIFGIAFSELVTEVKSQPTKSKKGKPITPQRPATYFRNT